RHHLHSSAACVSPILVVGNFVRVEVAPRCARLEKRESIRQVQRRQRLLPFRGLGGEETREGLVVLVGRRRGQGARGGLRARRGKNGGALLHHFLPPGGGFPRARTGR